MRLRFRLIACEVLYREVCLAVALSPHTVDCFFTKKNAHDDSTALRKQIQAEIDQSAADLYDAILLGYGLCGNSTMGITAKQIPLVLPRAHDCCTLFLGSRQAFKEHFADNPSRPFSSQGYMERGQGYLYSNGMRSFLGLEHDFAQLAQLYGEDNARYIEEALHSKLTLKGQADKVIFIEMPQTTQPLWKERLKKEAQAAGQELQVVSGSNRLVRNLINGIWPPQEFLIVPPGYQTEGVYDWDQICRCTQ